VPASREASLCRPGSRLPALGGSPWADLLLQVPPRDSLPIPPTQNQLPSPSFGGLSSSRQPQGTPRSSSPSSILLLAGAPRVMLPLAPGPGTAALSLVSARGSSVSPVSRTGAAPFTLLPFASPWSRGRRPLRLCNLAESEQKPPPPGVMSQGLLVQMKPVLPAPAAESATLNVSPPNPFQCPLDVISLGSVCLGTIF